MPAPKANPSARDRLDAFATHCCGLDDPAVELDLSLSGISDAERAALGPRLHNALTAMAALEGGAIANRDEGRMVGHYWLRAPARAPSAELGDAIAKTLSAITEFAGRVHGGSLAPPEGGAFAKVLLIGIGGSALGPMLAADALAPTDAPMRLCVLDNTDPDGIDRTLAGLGTLQDALVIVVSKSGSTPETRNGMLEVMRACAAEGLSFPARAVAITTDGSALHQRATTEGWLATFPMWDWVGGRTSVTSAVGLLPLALLGIDVRALLAGAAAMDEAGRRTDLAQNPAAALATLWWCQTNGRGERAMVVLPYKDRLILISRYLQQLVMESLGKRLDRQGKVVEQGLSVYGNKGSTDQHAFVQQLRDGRADFFALFVRVLRDRAGASVSLQDGESGPTTGDDLDGFLLGTRQALADNGRRSATLTIDSLDARALGALVALFERAVGLYAELIDVNAYHQPGVEAGKKAAQTVLELQTALIAALGATPKTLAALAEATRADPGLVWAILQHLAANRDAIRRHGPADPRQATFSRA